MLDFCFENYNKATTNYPYIDLDMKNINYFPHYHEDIEIIAVVEGEVTITRESTNYNAVSGDICIFMPGEIHSFSSAKSNHLNIIKINCQHPIENIDFASLRIKPTIITPEYNLNSSIQSDIDKIKTETEQKVPGYTYSVNSISNHLLYKIIRSNMLYNLSDINRKKHLTSLRIFKKGCEYIDLHFTEHITLSNVSTFCGFSQYYFSHSFKESTGKSFYDYLTSYRLNKIIPILLSSSDNITFIAYNNGFSNVRSFNRAFKKYFHTTPSEYKKTAISKLSPNNM